MVVLAAACGGGSPFTLVSPAVSRGEGVDLASLTVVEDGRDNADVDFFIQQAMVVSLRGQHDETFCDKGRKFAALSEIPLGTSDCPTALGQAWSRIAYLAGSAVHPPGESFAAGYGYLVRTRDRARLFRMLVVRDTYDETGTATVTLDVAPVP